MNFQTYVIGSSLAEILKIEIQGPRIEMMWTEDLIRSTMGLAKFDIEIRSDWLSICFTFVRKSPGS